MIDDQFELICLHHRHVRRLGTVEDAPDVGAGLPPRIQVFLISPPISTNSRFGNAVGIAWRVVPGGEKGVSAHEKRIGPVAQSAQCCINLLAGAGMDDLDMRPHRASSIAPSSLGVGSIADGIEIGTEILIFM